MEIFLSSLYIRVIFDIIDLLISVYRKVLLSSLMLCAAAEGGDFEEVRRLIEAGTSPNGKALW